MISPRTKILMAFLITFGGTWFYLYTSIGASAWIHSVDVLLPPNPMSPTFGLPPSYLDPFWSAVYASIPSFIAIIPTILIAKAEVEE